jgi:hypothetical protein
MADSSCTIRKIVLPVPLLEKTGRYFRERGEADYKARHLVDLCMASVDSFPALAVRVSGIRGYQNFVATVFHTRTTAVTLFFKHGYWERICRVQNALNIGCGDVVRLTLASLLFNSGTIALPLEKLSRLFISERQAYTYNMLLTRPVAGLLKETEQTLLPVNREALIRASHCYFSAVPDALPVSIPETRYRVDNGTTGWSRQTVTGSLEMKTYFRRLKESTGTSLSVVIAHTAYSFLEQLREARTDEER